MLRPVGAASNSDGVSSGRSSANALIAVVRCAAPACRLEQATAENEENRILAEQFSAFPDVSGKEDHAGHHQRECQQIAGSMVANVRCKVRCKSRCGALRRSGHRRRAYAIRY